MRTSSHLLAIMHEKNCVNREQNEWKKKSVPAAALWQRILSRGAKWGVIIVTFLKYLI